MLVFRSASWHSIEVNLSDPLFTDAHRREAAAMIVTSVQRGISLAAARADAEKILYMRLYDSLVMRKEHGAPENQKE